MSLLDYKTVSSLTKHSLIIISPAKKLTDFVFVQTNIYKTSVSYFPERFCRNGTDLILVSDIASITDSTKYYYENGYIYFYVPTTDYFVYYFNLYFGDYGFKLPKDLNLAGSAEIVYFEPRITGNPGITKTQIDKMQGLSVVGDASFRLINTNQDIFANLETLLIDHSFVNKDVKIYRYLQNEELIQGLFRGQIVSWSVDRTSVSFTAKDFASRLDSFIQTAEYNTTDFPEVDPSMVGKVMRWVYGKAMIKAVNIDYKQDSPTTSDNRIWRVTGHANKAIDEIWIQDKKITSQYSLNGDKNEITFTSSLESTFSLDTLSGSEDVFVLCQGRMDGGSNLINNASDIIKEILLQIGYTTAELNLQSFIDAKAANTYQISLALPQGVSDDRDTANAVFEKINKSVLGFLTIDNDFKLRFDIYQEKTSSAELNKDYDLINRNISAETMDLYSKIIVNYNYSEYTGEFLSKTYQDNDALYLHENKQSTSIDSVLLLESDALLLAQAFAAYYKNPIWTESFKIKLQLDDKIMGAFVDVDGKKCEIININKSINETDLTVRRV